MSVKMDKMVSSILDVPCQPLNRYRHHFAYTAALQQKTISEVLPSYSIITTQPTLLTEVLQISVQLSILQNRSHGEAFLSFPPLH